MRWDSNASQFYHQTIEDTKVEKPTGIEKVESEPTRVTSATSALFVGNIPYSTTEDDLREIFSVYGPLSRVAVGKNNEGRSKGYAHVDFKLKEDAMKANKDHEGSPMTIGDREARVNFAFPWRHSGGPALPRRGVKDRREPSTTIFVGGVPHEATRDDIREALKPFGDVVAVRVALSQGGNPKGFAHVDFTTTAEAEKVLDRYQHHPIHILDQEVRLDRSAPAETAYPPSPRIYFTKWEGNASSLRSHFRALCSKIVDMYFLTNPDADIVTGSGFVEFCDLETAKEALVRFNSPELALAYARPIDRSKPRSTTRRGEKSAGSSFGIKRRHERGNRDE